MKKLCLILSAAFVLLLASCVGAGQGEASLSVETPAVLALSVITPAPASPETAPLTSPPEAPAAALLVYDPLRLPAYAEDFLGDALSDYYAVIRAVEAGETAVQLSGTSDFARVERVVHALYAPKMLLHDAQFFSGEGPFAYDPDTAVLTIRYLYGRETHSVLMEAFALRMNEALSAASGCETARDTARELYIWVASNLHYELDMRLTVYDAVTTGRAYCQTYAMLYQLLLTQAGIPCYQVGGSVDFDGDGTIDGEHAWNRLLLDGEWVFADPTWEYGDLKYFAMTRETCIKTGHLEPYLDPCDALYH